MTVLNVVGNVCTELPLGGANFVEARRGTRSIPPAPVIVAGTVTGRLVVVAARSAELRTVGYMLAVCR